MKQFLLLSAVFCLFGALPVLAQPSVSRYETELLSNPNKGQKDTREVNAVLIFENDVVKIVSRRSLQIFKQFKYSEIKTVEHSFSKSPFYSDDSRQLILAALFWYEKKEKHWLTLQGENDFAVLKIENDNYRLIKMEFKVRKFEIENINENKE